MQIFARKRFLRHCPGPYTYLSSRDGVDRTFDIYCLTTENYIVSTYYWEERKAAEATAATITAALNAFAGHPDTMPPESGPFIGWFVGAHPRPFGLRRGVCPGGEGTDAGHGDRSAHARLSRPG